MMRDERAIREGHVVDKWCVQNCGCRGVEESQEPLKIIVIEGIERRNKWRLV